MPPPFENEKTIIESQAGQHRSTVPSSEEPNHLRDGLTQAQDLRLRAESEAVQHWTITQRPFYRDPKHREMPDL